jgi:hypothetical protein
MAMGLASLVAIGGLAAADGGYFPPAWGWSTLAFLWLSALAVLVQRHQAFRTLDACWLGGLVLFTGWILLSLTWTSDATQTVLEGQRALVYVAAALALLLLGRRRLTGPLLAGALAGVTVASAYGLATRLFPDRVAVFDPAAGYRLSEPIGYWNALGVLSALAATLALILAVTSRRTAGRMAAALPLAILVPAMYFTFSRGAWVSLGISVAVAFAVARHRLRLIGGILTLAPAPAIAVWVASRPEALRRQDASLEEAASAGHRVALELVVVALLAAALAGTFALLERRVRLERRTRRALGTALALGSLATAVVTLASLGGPVEVARRVRDAFGSPPPQGDVDVSARLFSLSGSYRDEMWRVAWDDFRAHPWLGSGAGTYEEFWNKNRAVAHDVRDAHSLYLETLAELGPLGFALLLCALAAPLAAIPAARKHPLAPAAAAIYVGFLVHAGADWDWEVPAVTLVGMSGGAVLLIAARGGHGEKSIGARLRVVAVGAILALTLATMMGFVGNSALDSAVDELYARDHAAAESQMRKAQRWAPWSSEPWRVLGFLELSRGNRPAARASFRKGLAKDRRDWELWYGLALANRGRERQHALDVAKSLNPLASEIAAERGGEIAGPPPPS